MVEGIKPYVEWNDDWATGVVSIDSDHKYLVALIQKLFNGMMSEKGTHFLNTIFVEIIEYAKYHFKREERTYEQYQFDKIEEHRVLHQQLINQILNKGAKLVEKGNEQDLSFEILDFLKHWLVNHIVKEDLKFKYFLQERGISVESTS